ncbi:MAG: hypothetical protein LBN21_07635 [Treponema sp.]|jgi:hypothetical protein|nr:hypothetical protein [Treponema sp.]
MKNKLSFGVLFILAAFVVLVAGGCVTTQTTEEHQGNFGEHTRIPVKDFQTLGLVFTETQLAAADNGKDEGQIFTYQALLKEAQALGADAIINVVIDKKIEASSSPGRYSTTWYGSALAIKYTATLTETMVTSDGVVTTSTTSVYFNYGGIADTGSAAAKPSAGEQPPPPIKGIRQ